MGLRGAEGRRFRRRAISHKDQVMRVVPFLCVLAVSGVAISQPTAGQPTRQITIRFLNFKTLKPLRGLAVIVTISNEDNGKGISESGDRVTNLSLKTDHSGTLRVNVPVPYPKSVTVFAPGLVDNVVSEFSIAAVMESGAIRRFPGQQFNKKREGDVDPGQVLILSRKETAWDRIKREFP